MAKRTEFERDYDALTKPQLIEALSLRDEALEAMPEGFVLYDKDGRLRLCNRVFRGIYAWARDIIKPGVGFEALVRSGIAAGAYPEAQDRPEDYVAERLAQFSDFHGTSLRHLSDGRWLQCRNRLTQDGNVVGIRSDVTDVKRHEQEVVDREVRLAGMLSVTPDAIIAIGADAKIRVFNTGAEKLFGHKAGDMIGQPLDRLMPARFQTAHAGHIKRFLAAPEQSRLMTERGEIIGVKADGSEFPAEASVSKLELDDETILTVMLHDVTERKRAEAGLIAAKEEAERALIQAEKMAAIGTLASGIGHEINNPLYAILGAAEAIRDGNDLSRCREHGQDIITYCKHIAEIIKNLSGYIRPGEKHGLEPVDVNEAVSEAVAMARLSLLAEGIEIIERLGPVAQISAKSEEIQQAFFNIIRNGLQAIGRKGTLEIDSRQKGSLVSVRIRDTGAGIAANDLARIFDPFFTTKDPDEGEGIGLFVVQQIVNKYAGTIDFESEPGEGTLCTIEFPILGTREGTA